MLNRTVISKSEFEHSIHHGSHYEGFVTDVGYVYWARIVKYGTAPSFPNDTGLNRQNGVSYIAPEEFIPVVIPEDVLFQLVTIKPEEILKAITRDGQGNTLIMSLFDGKEVTVSKSNCQINVTIDEGYFNGSTQRIVTVCIKDGNTGNTIESTCSLKDAMALLSGSTDYLSYIAGATGFHLEAHLEANHRWRAAKTTGGYTVANEAPIYKWFGISGETARKFIYPALKYGGVGLGLLGLAKTYKQYKKNEISEDRAKMDAIMGIIGFLGIPGMIFSMYYFFTVSPNLDNPISTKNSSNNYILLPDNTRVVNKRNELYR